MSETIKLCAMLARAVFENDDEAREPFVEQAMRAKREHDEMRRELAEARAELARCADAAAGFFQEGDTVADAVQVAVDAFGHSNAAMRGFADAVGRARATIEQADDTRREWEVRAATSYAAGRAAGLREAAASCVDVVRLDFPTGGTVENVVAMVVKRCVDRIHALTGPSGRCPEKWGGAGSQCKHNAGHDGRHSWESEPHKVSGPSTDEEVEASDNLVIKENARKAKPNG